MSIRVKSKIQRNNSPIMPSNIRCMIVGSSGCGKTSLLSQMLLMPNLLDYNKLVICCPMIDQPVYEFLANGFGSGCNKNVLHELVASSIKRPIDEDELDSFFKSVSAWKEAVGEAIKNGEVVGEEELHLYQQLESSPKVEVFEQIEDLPSLTEWSKNENKVIVFDDVLEENQKIIEPFFTKARHKNFDTFYLAQDYWRTPKQCIRTNLNLLIVFPLNSDEVNLIYRAHVKPDISREQFDLLCKEAWSKPYGYLIIDKTSPPFKGKYRTELNTCVISFE